jgi:hypothetical protein
MTGRGDLVIELTHEDRCAARAEFEDGQIGMVLERRRAVARRLGLSDPQLSAMDLTPVCPLFLLGMGDPLARTHQIQLAGSNPLLGPQTVMVHDFASEKPRHGLQSNVGMGAHIEPLFC